VSSEPADADRHAEYIDRVVQGLRSCRSLLFVTGAGISAESGLPTYRGVGGLYDAGRGEGGRPIEELLSGHTFREDPAVTWKYLMQIATACQGATCNRAHEVLAEMEREFDRVCVVTQNVDGFHHAAGSRNVIDLHGDIHALKCTRCEYHEYRREFGSLELPPRCPECRSVVRPDVVLFGEMLPTTKTDRLHAEVTTGFDMAFSIGTTSVFDYIAWPILQTHDRGCPTVEINPGRSQVSEVVDVRLPLPAGQALDAIWTRFLGPLD
jgi:NAD-dependent deacetylase